MSNFAARTIYCTALRPAVEQPPMRRSQKEPERRGPGRPRKHPLRQGPPPAAPSTSRSTKSTAKESAGSPRSLARPGCLVWAKVRGYPWWPGRIAPLSGVPRELANVARTQYAPGSMVAVYFFGSHDFSLVSVDALKPLRDHWDAFSAAGSGARFARALSEARDPRRHTPASISLSSSDSDESDVAENVFSPRVDHPHRAVATKASLEMQFVSEGESQKTLALLGNKSNTHSMAADALMLCRNRLQRLLFRPTPMRNSEARAVERVLVALSKVSVSMDDLAGTQIARVLRLARQNDALCRFPSLAAAVDTLLASWRIELAEYVALIGV